MVSKGPRGWEGSGVTEQVEKAMYMYSQVVIEAVDSQNEIQHSNFSLDPERTI